MNHKIGIVAIVIALGGCAPTSRMAKIALPDNQDGFVIECRHLANCYNRAQEVCPAGYELLDKESSTQGGFANGVGAMGTKKSLVVRCKK